MRRWLPLALGLAGLAAFAAADDRGPVAPPRAAEPAAEPAAPVATDPVKALAERCRYVPAPFEMSVREPVKFGEKLVVEKMEFPSPVASADPDRNDVVKAKLFRTAEPEPALVVALGGWRRDPMTPQLGSRLAEATGIQVLCIDLPFQGERTPRGKQSGEVTFSADLDQNLATFVQAAQDVERAVDWMVRERKVDPKRIGILGTSLGGFVSADLFGLTDRFACATVQLAGGDVAAVIFNGNWLTGHIRERFVANGLTEEMVRERMRPVDPLTWARKDRKDGLLVIAAENDEIVPLASVRSLVEAYGGARLVVIPGSGHINPQGLESKFPEAIAHFADRLLPAKVAAPGTPAAPATK